MATPAAARGFTLIELMIVLAVLAIIMAIAIPSYTAQTRKSRRSEAIARIQDFQLRQEQWRSENAAYATDAQLTTPDPPNYTITVSAQSATDFTITATGTGDQANDKQGATACGTLVLRKNASPQRTPVECWR